jgi:hypothetical protein
MRYRKTDVIVWHGEYLTIDLPYGSTSLHTMSDGTLRAVVKTPKGESSLDSLVDCVGKPIRRRSE